MATPQRLKKLTPTDVWSCKERLCLASSVMRSGDQNWVSVSRAIKPFGEPNRPADWFSQKNCALQYSELLEKVETPKRKRGERGENETPGESIVRNLTAERIEELKRLIQQDKQSYMRLKRLVEHVKSGAADDNLQELWDEILEEKNKKKLEEQKYHIWLQERENAKQAALAALKTVKIVPNAKKSSVKRLVLGRRSSSQSEHGSEPESNMESPLNETLIVDNVPDDILLSHDIVSNIPPFSSPAVGPALTPAASCTSPVATSGACHHSPLLNNLLRSTSQSSTPSPSTASPTKEISPRSQAALFSPTITSLLSANSNIPSLPTSVANLLTTALTGPPDSDSNPPRPPVQSPSQGAPTLLKLLDMPLGIPGKLPPLPIISNPDPIPVSAAVTLPPLPQSPVKLSSSTITTTSTQAPIASVAMKLEDRLVEPVAETSVNLPIEDISEGDLTMEVKMEVLEESNVEAVATAVDEDSMVISQELSVVEEVTVVEEITEIVEEVVEEVGDVVEVVEEVYVDVVKQVTDAASSEKTEDVGNVVCVKDEVIEDKKEAHDASDAKELVVEEENVEEKEAVECVVVSTKAGNDDGTVAAAVPSEDTVEEVADAVTSPPPAPIAVTEAEAKTETETPPICQSEKADDRQEEVELLDVVKESKAEELIVVDDDVVSVSKQDYDSDQMTVVNVESEEGDGKVLQVEAEEGEEEERKDKDVAETIANVNIIEVPKVDKVEAEEHGDDDDDVVDDNDDDKNKSQIVKVVTADESDNKCETRNETIHSTSTSKEIPCPVDSSDDEEDVPLLCLVKNGKSAILDTSSKSNVSMSGVNQNQNDGPARSTRKGDGDKDKEKEKVKVETPQVKKLGPGKAWRKGLKGSASEAAAALKAAEDTGNEDDSDRASGKQESGKAEESKPEGTGVGRGKKIITRKRKEKEEKEAVAVPAPMVEAEVVVQKPTRRSKEEIPKAGGKHKTTLAISKGPPDIEISDDDERNSDREDSISARGILSSGDELDSTRDYRVWKKAIMLVWRTVATHKYANVFLHPVTDEEAPGYQIVVNRPMDLQTIKRNIESGQIRTTSEFRRDVMLMFQNAIMYNSSDHDVFKMAIEMQKEVMGHIQDFLTTQLMVQTTGVPLTLRRETREQTMKRSEICDKLPITPTLQSATQERRASQIISRASFLTSDEPPIVSAPRTRTSSSTSSTMTEMEPRESYTTKRKRSFGDSDGGKVKKRRTRADD